MCNVFFFKQKTAYEMRISDWSSDVCSSDLRTVLAAACVQGKLRALQQLGKGLYALLATRRAAVDGRVVQRYGARIRAAPIVAAFRALSLRKYRVDAVNEQRRMHKKSGALWAPEVG